MNCSYFPINVKISSVYFNAMVDTFMTTDNIVIDIKNEIACSSVVFAPKKK